MGMSVVVQEPEEFEMWLLGQAAPAAVPDPGSAAARGLDVFVSSGCGACHSVRGTPADGLIGPDLTHVGSRLTIGAATLPTDPESFRRFVARTHEVKPDVLMPAFGMLPAQDLDALAAYLASLE